MARCGDRRGNRLVYRRRHGDMRWDSSVIGVGETWLIDVGVGLGLGGVQDERNYFLVRP
jgi:hypothetical protein